MGWIPEVTVAAVVSHERKFLLVEELIDGRLVLNQPAGHLEPEETLLSGVIRETREETAWRFTPTALVGAYLWRGARDGRGFMRFAFCGDVDDHRPHQPLDRGIVRTLWLTREELQARQDHLRSPLVLRCVDDYLLGSRLALDTVAALDLESARHAPSGVSVQSVP